MSKWVKPGSMGKVAPGYDVRIVNNMGKVTSMSKVAVFIFHIIFQIGSILCVIRIVSRRCRGVSRATSECGSSPRCRLACSR